MSKTPKLRFKEFSGDWEEKKLEELVKSDKKITYGVVKPGRFDENGIILIKASDYSKGWVDINSLFKISKELDNSYKRSKVSTDDILYTIVGSVGNVAIVPREFEGANITQQTARISVNEKNSHIFIYNFLTSNINKKQLLNYLKSGVQPSINLSDLERFKINIPSIEEQEKIASFFSLIDDKISLQGEKVEALKDYKTGMMQKIFSRELRFKDDEGRDYPEWEEKKLGDISDIGTGSNDLQDKVDDGIYPFFVRSANIERINSYTFDVEAILIPGDGNIGQIYHYINGKFAYHQRVYKISDFVEGISGKYIYYYMSRFFLKEALKNSVKATVDSLRLPTLTGMKVLLPCIEEQVKISEVLNKLEEKINKEQEKLDTLNEYKKGLLQQMFV